MEVGDGQVLCAVKNDVYGVESRARHDLWTSVVAPQLRAKDVEWAIRGVREGDVTRITNFLIWARVI